MSFAGSTRLFLAVFAALALVMFVNAHAAFAQDDADSSATSDSGAPTDDANWESAEPTGPPIDESAASADKVLEIPPAKCSSNDDPTAPCDGADTNNAADDNDQSINAPSPGAPPQSFDEDTASYAQDADWGTVDDYQNQQANNGPYAMYPYPGGVIGTLQRPAQLPQSTLAQISSPLTQAARPPLNQGPWMTPPTMSAYNRPAGSPMMPMSSPLVGFHH